MKSFTCRFRHGTIDRKWKTLSKYFLWIMLVAVSANIGISTGVWPQTGLTYTYFDTSKNNSPDADTVTVIGHPVKYIVQKGDTLLDIARDFRLGFNELEDLYPELNPWVPTAGKELVLPRMWVLPQVRKSGIVINLAEFRLYQFLDKKKFLSNTEKLFQENIEDHVPDVSFVRTYPVGIGDETWNSPEGSFRIIDKRVKPAWYIPPSLVGKYHPIKVVPPGPNNPLGDYFMGIGDAYGIHGTDNPWSVGRMVTHGCIRLYPEDIEFLFPTVAEGTPVQIVYEPVKIGFLNGRIYVEVHKDIYEKISDFNGYGYQKLSDLGLMETVDQALFEAELERKSGMPVEVGKINSGIKIYNPFY
jgi:L,D-transpeptidase ErfK/SrfK